MHSFPHHGNRTARYISPGQLQLISPGQLHLHLTAGVVNTSSPLVTMALLSSKFVVRSPGVCCSTRVSISHRRPSTVQHAFLDSLKSIFTGDAASKERKLLETKLLEAVKGTKRGLSTSKEQASSISSVVESLQELWLDKPTTTSELSATWRLLWTTEKVG